ncbi:MAG: fibrobacter succinogenes major paralogous domain-containing protein [Fibrobacter sp.]|nr:fibrobacter succinogenes major paralogous domain-containing protein [Fibrobacter sp.]
MYFTCKSSVWAKSTAFEYDTYGWNAGTEGEVKAGSVNTSNYYIYKNDKWQTATSVEVALNGCTVSREGEVAKLGNAYYICKSKNWKTATALEYDTYGEKCSATEVGKTVDGVVTATNKYYCTTNGWVSLTGDWNWKVPNEARMNSTITYGTMTDLRDKKVYKTVTIGNQVWMAENLNYADSTISKSLLKRNWCYGNVSANCDVGGRLYTWAAAVDSVALYDGGNGVNCGYYKTCSLPAKVQGVCPDGWHLPTKAEWNTLFTEVGGSSTAGKILKSQTGWYNHGDGTDGVGFSAIPAGVRNEDGNFILDGRNAYFWSATENDRYYAYVMYLYYSYEEAYLSNFQKYDGFSVRCLKDSN